MRLKPSLDDLGISASGSAVGAYAISVREGLCLPPLAAEHSGLVGFIQWYGCEYVKDGEALG